MPFQEFGGGLPAPGCHRGQGYLRRISSEVRIAFRIGLLRHAGVPSAMTRRVTRAPRRLVVAAILGVCLALGRSAEADPYRTPLKPNAPEMAPLTFSKFVVRLSMNEIVIDGGALRVAFLEALRSRGYPAVGAESLAFDTDGSGKARFVLGATATEIACKQLRISKRCSLGVKWEVLDQSSSSISYRVFTRHAAVGFDDKQLAEELVWGNFYSLLSRPRFLAALTPGKPAPAASPKFATVRFRQCRREPIQMPSQANAALDATALVEAGDRLGSGSVISPDGFVLTAAHVVDGAGHIEVQPRSRPRAAALLVRLDRASDVALLKIAGDAALPCVEPRTGDVTIGEELFAIGSPLGRDLSFTLTRGIASGVRNLDGVSLIQTDASINRGNSGGPLLDSKGRIVGVVSWKLAGADVEGIAFGVNASLALTRLGIEPGESTDVSLTRAQASGLAAPASSVDDAPDPRPSLEPPPPPPPAPDKPKGPKTATARTLGWAGWVTAGAGVLGVGATYGWYELAKGSLRTDGFDRLRLANDVSWVVLAAGAGMVVTSELLPRDPLPAPARGNSRPRVRVGLGAGFANVRGEF